MGNTIIPLGKSDERCGVMLEFENVKMTNLLNWWQMPHSGLNGWFDLFGIESKLEMSTP
ncbi:hypothetical protein H6G96_08660 [Nostoc sp. FACHB-892]|uniref:hypothetical protein n=1 Tax=Nostoc sp. FACHB-892 TaxID=2692843 RepID=UPI001686E5CD|nr:hypothetical protein [Nostoc sp. FACHB-892]MBD2726397.1 hypothetical protein [Nostoc sp. FACHB-892]